MNKLQQAHYGHTQSRNNHEIEDGKRRDVFLGNRTPDVVLNVFLVASNSSGFVFFWYSRAQVQWLSGWMHSQGYQTVLLEGKAYLLPGIRNVAKLSA